MWLHHKIEGEEKTQGLEGQSLNSMKLSLENHTRLFKSGNKEREA
jgi:hypothetical protein